MADVEIRAPEPHDVADLAELFQCPGVVANTLQLPWRSVEFRRERLALHSPERHPLVAIVDGRVVGLLDLHIQQSPRRRQSANIGMAVHDAYQGQGIGSALMTAMIELADNWIGLRRIELTVFTDNRPAVHLYEKFGFVIEGTARQYALRNGSYVDAHYMARLRGQQP